MPSDATIRRNLFRQAAFLSRNIEWHHPGNHLLENARALLVAASAFSEEREARKWAQRAVRILEAGVPDQVLADGVHAERSPMYHALVLEGLLDSIASLKLLERDDVIRTPEILEMLQTSTADMCDYLVAVTHPDGGVGLLNDSTAEIAPTTDRIISYSKEVAVLNEPAGRKEFPEAGHFMYRDADVYLLVDGGPVGPDHLPAHAHADTFTYEFDVDGKRLIVDSGVCEYEKGPLRDWVRSTAAHNTLTVDGQDQAECWKKFRVARRFPPRDVEFNASRNGCRFSGSFDGYATLIGDGIVHWRSLEVDTGTRTLKVSDRIEGSGEHRVVSRVHFHPDWTIAAKGESSFAVTHESGEAQLRFAGGDPAIETSIYCPEFGLHLEKSVFCLVYDGELPARLTYTLEY